MFELSEVLAIKAVLLTGKPEKPISHILVSLENARELGRDCRHVRVVYATGCHALMLGIYQNSNACGF